MARVTKSFYWFVHFVDSPDKLKERNGNETLERSSIYLDIMFVLMKGNVYCLYWSEKTETIMMKY